MNIDPQTAKIRQLNDRLRQTGRGGRVMITRGIQALGEQSVAAIIAKVRAFDTFTPDNDPWQEHDYGKFVHDGQNVLFKIDYYDLAMKLASPDPSDPKVTTRILTVMTAEEY